MFRLSHILCTSLMTMVTVTRIPLDTPAPQTFSQSQIVQSRPPWIRPVRKRTRATNGRGGTASGESDNSRHGSPAEDANSPVASALSPSSHADAFGSSTYQRQPATSPASTTGSFGRAPSGSRGDNLLSDLRDGGALGLSANAGMNPDELMGMTGMNGMNGLNPMSSIVGMSNMGMEGIDSMGGAGMSSSAFMTLLNDGSFDMATLFSGDFAGAAGTPVSPTNGDMGASAMTGIVASP